MVEIIFIALGVFVAAAAALVAWLTYFEKRKRARILKFEEEKKLRDEKTELRREILDIKKTDALKQGIVISLREVLDEKIQNYETTTEAKKRNKQIWEKLNQIEKSLKSHFNESIESEIGRLAHDIIGYADDLRVGIAKSRVSFLHISVSYDRYKELGGNHYVDEQYKFIKGEMKEIGE